MDHPLLVLVPAISTLLASCASITITPSVDPRAELLALHEQVLQAHRESNADLLLRSEASGFVSADRGQVTRPTFDERRARFQQDVGTIRFTEYIDLVPPVVRVSKDGTVGWVIVQVRAAGVHSTQDGGSHPFAFESAWVELYERRGRSWYRTGNVSSSKP